VKFERVLDAFDGPFERLPYGQLETPPPGKVESANGAIAGFLASHRVNDTTILANRLLKAGAEAYWLKSPPARATEFGPGALYVPNRPGARRILEQAAKQLGLDLRAVAARPAPADLITLQPIRIALWDRFGGSMPSGWTRWLFEQFEFPFDVIYSSQIDAGKLREKYDAIVFVGGSIPAPGVRPPPLLRPRNLPPQYESWIGRITPDKSLPPLKEFLHAGGTIIAIGSATNLAYHLAEGQLIPLLGSLMPPLEKWLYTAVASRYSPGFRRAWTEAPS
jgi:hypothetical protein